MRTLSLLFVLLLQDYKNELPRLKPTEAADAIKTFTLAPGYRIELVAAEPLVASPVDLAFDEEGRLWVVEMVDYPFNETEGNPAQGRVVRLEDPDGDGRFDTRVVIADKISCPTGLALWDGGAFVTAPPVLLYVKEGVRRVVQSGFGVQNIQGLANNIKWGLDNWFHASGGTNGGTIAPAGIGINGRDFRFRPSGEFEALSGGGQFGSSFDDFGRRFVCSNANSARHVVLDDAVLRHNPYYAVSAMTASIAAEGDAGTVYRTSPQEPWRVLRTRLRKEGVVRGGVEGMTTFTSATGIFFHWGRLYVGEVSHNLVSRKSLAPHGTTFRAERIDKEGEFLASTDNWFRPANFATGPDGALYVCDMYRECIEHPHSLPEFIKKHLDLTSGKDRGRIWRIVETDGPKWTKPRLRSIEDLVDALRRPEAWHRQTAGRLLHQRQDKAAIPRIEKLLADERPETRAAALWALEGLGTRRGEVLLKDPSPDVREQAVRLSRVESLFDLSDEAPRVRFQLACRLAESKDPRAKAAVERLRPGADRWLLTAIAIASGERSAPRKIADSKTEAPALVGDRKRVVESYRGVLALKGDGPRGREVYRKSCSGCHRAAGEGKDVGPDLATVKQRTPEELMIAILDPNREVNPQFVAVRIKMKNDQILDGLIGTENLTSITIKRPEGLVDTIIKADIDRMVRSSLSLMPEGLEKAIDAQQLADLIQFIRE